jgi:uncharacterized protein YfbU (UPF0304 family)
LIRRADSLYKAKDYQNSIKLYEQGFKLERRNYMHLYNAACSAALAGQKKKALAMLDESVQQGWTNITHLKQDADLTSLHGERQWQEVVDKLQKRVNEVEKNVDKPLQAELLQIYELDQKYRKMRDSVQKSYGMNSGQMQELMQTMQEQDSRNLVKVKAILDQQGWVGPRKVGRQASHVLFLVIQHSDQTTQEKYLPMMREAVRKGDEEASSLALLEDRVALGQGKKQLYGSQIGINKETGKYYVLPLEDPSNVDKRRASVGLPPLAEYVQHYGITWNLDEYMSQQGK